MLIWTKMSYSKKWIVASIFILNVLTSRRNTHSFTLHYSHSLSNLKQSFIFCSNYGQSSLTTLQLIWPIVAQKTCTQNYKKMIFTFILFLFFTINHARTDRTTAVKKRYISMWGDECGSFRHIERLRIICYLHFPRGVLIAIISGLVRR